MHVPWTGTQLRNSMQEASPPSFSLTFLFFSPSVPVSLVLPSFCCYLPSDFWISSVCVCAYEDCVGVCIGHGCVQVPMNILCMYVGTISQP